MKNNNLENILKLKSNNTYKTFLLGDLVEITENPKANKNKCKQNREYEIWGRGINPKGLHHEYNVSENSITISRAGSYGYINYNT